MGLFVAAAAAAALIGPERALDRSGFSAARSRQVTGIAVTGTAGAPVVYVTSSDPRTVDFATGESPPIDTNSGVVSILEHRDGAWTRRDLVRGLPRSRWDHGTNGLLVDVAHDRLYVAQGGTTNMGAPSARFGNLPEYALSGAILSIDLDRLGEGTYDLPTLDDELRPGTDDRGDPFGGDDGRNQAVLVPGGPVQLLGTGLRNPYDVVLTRKGLVYTVDNGPDWFWGDAPNVVDGKCTNREHEGGRYLADALYLVEEGFYGGHPNPTRASRATRFNLSNPQSPIARPRPEECLYTRGQRGRALVEFDTSTNGLAEFTASNFGGAMSGDLIAASFDRRIYRLHLDESGRRVIRKTPLAVVDGYPLDVTTQPDDGPFPGTIWITDWLSGDLIVLEPRDRETGPHWSRLAPSGFPRQEVSWVRVGDRFYLAGGDRRQEAYDPLTDTWHDVAPLPEKLDHIQGVPLGGRIYYIGGLSSFPKPAVGTVWIYDPKTDSFSRGAPMPRPRGAGGVAVHEGKVYYAGGLSQGKAVSWFDVYDPSTDSWSRAPDMPRPRDHFQAQVVGSRFYAIGGRDTDVGANMGDNDAFDFVRGRWMSGLAPLPTPRGGYASAVVGDEILILGGEAPDKVFASVEAYDVRKDTWRALEPMPTPRHGIEAITCGGDVYVAAGGTEPYGDAPSNVTSVYVTGLAGRCPLGAALAKSPATVGFRATRVHTGVVNPTSLQFGPDGRLYVSEQTGTIAALTLHRTDAGTYELLEHERIDAIRDIPNHNDDGSLAVRWGMFARLVANHLGICCSFPGELPPPASRAAPSEPPSSERGRALYRDAGCVGCHSFAPAGSTALTGPPLDRSGGLPRAYLAESILDPDAVIVPGYPPSRMPPDYGLSISRQQLADLIAFIREHHTR